MEIGGLDYYSYEPFQVYGAGVSKTDELRIKNEEFCIKNEELCIN